MYNDDIFRLKKEESIFISQQSKEMLKALYGYEPITDSLYICLFCFLTEQKCYILLEILNDNFVKHRQHPLIFESLSIK